MIIEKIAVTNLRKLKSFTTDFISDTNIIVGPNGSGKTSILEAIFFIGTAKSFRSKYSQSIIKKGEREFQAKATIKENENKTIKAILKEKKKKFLVNDKPIKTTSELIKDVLLICVSPEEIDVIEEYKKEKQKYFDRIIFKTNKSHIINIKNYNKVLAYRNSLLENNMETDPWDQQILEIGTRVWETREIFFNEFIKTIKKTQKNLKIETQYNLFYKPKKLEKEEYLFELKKKTKNNKTPIGPHKDTIEFHINKEQLKEHGSQGEKKLFKYILKLAETDHLLEKTKKRPTILLDDFFAKLDDENIMKIFLYFHCKFQTIITTTNTDNQTLKNIQNSNKIKTILFK